MSCLSQLSSSSHNRPLFFHFRIIVRKVSLLTSILTFNLIFFLSAPTIKVISSPSMNNTKKQAGPWPALTFNQDIGSRNYLATEDQVTARATTTFAWLCSSMVGVARQQHQRWQRALSTPSSYSIFSHRTPWQSSACTGLSTGRHRRWETHGNSIFSRHTFIGIHHDHHQWQRHQQERDAKQ